VPPLRIAVSVIEALDSETLSLLAVKVMAPFWTCGGRDIRWRICGCTYDKSDLADRIIASAAGRWLFHQDDPQGFWLTDRAGKVSPA